MDFNWAALLGNHTVDALAKHGARYLVSFVGDFIPPSIIANIILTIVLFSDIFFLN